MYRLSLFSATTILITMILSPIGMSFMALYGIESIFYYLVVSVLFFIPSGIAVISLNRKYSSDQGMYSWLKSAFGENVSSISVWLQWLSVVVFYPTILTYLSGLILYMIDSSLINNHLIMFCLTLGLGWLTIIASLFGTEISLKLSTFGGICAAVLPSVVIIILAIIWLNSPNNKFSFSWHEMLPSSLNVSFISILVGTVVAFTGIEYSSYFSKELKKKSDYKRSVILALIIITILASLGTIGIVIIMSGEKINIISGFLQSIQVVSHAYGVDYMTYVMGVIFSIGFICVVGTLMLSVAKGLVILASENHLPKSWSQENRYGAPYKIILLQGAIMSVLCSLYLLLPAVSDTYWIAGVASALFVVIKYILMFAADLKGSNSFPEMLRKGPSVIGLVSCAIVMFLSFIPPEQLKTLGIVPYDLILVVIIFSVISIPVISNKAVRRLKTP